MLWITTIFVVLCAVGWNYRNILQHRFQQAKIAYAVFKGIPVATENNEQFVVGEKNASIEYQRLQKTYRIVIPFDRMEAMNMNPLRATLILTESQDGAEVDSQDITQQPGIPYLSSAKQLGGIAIEIFNVLTGMRHRYEGEVVPRYASEVMFEE